GSDGLMRRCVSEDEARSIIWLATFQTMEGIIVVTELHTKYYSVDYGGQHCFRIVTNLYVSVTDASA
ncbi:hypothetical protein A2U01_0082714, partial [Trifolium medium]|nr:hypothetical protein [Trifolium medium]